MCIDLYLLLLLGLLSNSSANYLNISVCSGPHYSNGKDRMGLLVLLFVLLLLLIASITFSLMIFC